MQRNMGGLERESTSQPGAFGVLQVTCVEAAFQFHLASHLALSGSRSIPGWTQGPAGCAHASFSQGGFQHEGVGEVSRPYYGLAPPPLRNCLLMHSLGGLLDPKNGKYVVSLSFT